MGGGSPGLGSAMPGLGAKPIGLDWERGRMSVPDCGEGRVIGRWEGGTGMAGGVGT